MQQAAGCALAAREMDGPRQLPRDRHAVLRAGDRLVVVASLQAAKQLERTCISITGWRGVLIGLPRNGILKDRGASWGASDPQAACATAP